jgi:hypothetical protein
MKASTRRRPFGGTSLADGCICAIQGDDDTVMPYLMDRMSRYNGELEGNTESTHDAVVPGLNGKAILLDGSADKVSIDGLGRHIEYDRAWTIAMLFKYDASDSGSAVGIVCNSASAVAGFSAYKNTSDVLICELTQSGSIYLKRTAHVLTPDTWYLLIWSYDGSETIGGFNVSINDVAVTSNASAGTFSAALDNRNFWIGTITGTSNYANMTWQHLYVWDRELSDEEKTLLYNDGLMLPHGVTPECYDRFAEFPSMYEGLKAEYLFQETSGTKLSDELGNFDGSLNTNASNLTADGGMLKLCYNWSVASNFYATLPSVMDKLFEQGRKFSVEIWFYGADYQRALFGYENTGTTKGFGIYTNAGYLRTLATTSSGNYGVVTNSNILLADTWNHGIVTYDGNSDNNGFVVGARTYSNGQSGQATVTSGTQASFESPATYIGRCYNIFDKEPMALVRIWVDRELNEADAHFLYNSGMGRLSRPSLDYIQSNIDYYYKLNDNAATSTIVDSTGTQNIAMQYGGNTQDQSSPNGKNGRGFLHLSSNPNRAALNAVDNPAGTLVDLGIPFSVWGWFRTWTTIPTVAYPFGSSNSTAYSGMSLCFRYGKPEVFFTDGSGKYQQYQHADVALEPNREYFIFFHYNGGAIDDQKNIVLVVSEKKYTSFASGSSSPSLMATFARSNNLVIGGNGNTTTYNFDGSVSEWGVSTSALGPMVPYILYNNGRGRFPY